MNRSEKWAVIERGLMVAATGTADPLAALAAGGRYGLAFVHHLRHIVKRWDRSLGCAVATISDPVCSTSRKTLRDILYSMLMLSGRRSEASPARLRVHPSPFDRKS